jgi:hypothetical protein
VNVGWIELAIILVVVIVVAALLLRTFRRP